MTNLEWFVNKENATAEGRLCAIAYFIDKKCQCNQRCDDCAYKTDKNKIMKIILAEHKDLIKLEQWQKDFLKYYTYVDDSWNGRILHEAHPIRYMCNKGYFKNVDLNMTFREVLDNCEVVGD